MISCILREGNDSIYIDKCRLVRAPAQSPLRVTEPDKSRVTYSDITPFSRNRFFGMFPKQTNPNFLQQNKTAKHIFRNVSKTNKSEFLAAEQICKRRLHLRKSEEPISLDNLTRKSCMQLHLRKPGQFDARVRNQFCWTIRHVRQACGCICARVG